MDWAVDQGLATPKELAQMTGADLLVSKSFFKEIEPS
jgi:hypothetical protein